MNQPCFPVIDEKRQELIQELEQELSVKLRQKEVVIQEVKFLQHELKRQLRRAGQRSAAGAQKRGGRTQRASVAGEAQAVASGPAS